MYLFLDEGMSPNSRPGVTNPHLPKPDPETPGNEINCFLFPAWLRVSVGSG